MSIITKEEVRLRTCKAKSLLAVSASALTLMFYGAANAQDTTAEDDAAVETVDTARDARIEEATEEDTIIVTGSRIPRNEFSSASPLQVIDGQISRELGVFDTARLIQESAVATGIQIDNTFTGFVLDNGPGASTVALRGIDPERTLIMLNGRRLGSGGTEGAPTSPDLNLIPSSLIGRIDVLLDGASPVYGSDAVAGVANVILRDDFDGLEIETAFNLPESGGGKVSQVSASWGITGDNGFIGVGAEFFRRDPYSIADAGYLCDEHFEIDDSGDVRNVEVDVRPGTTLNTCKTQIIGRFRNGNTGADFFYTPGVSNTGVADYSRAIDSNLDGLLDVDQKNPLYNGADGSRSLVQNQDLVSPLERISFMAFGNYKIEELNNMETFFELLYSQRDTAVLGDGAQIFPTIPESNPLNPCGLEAVTLNPAIVGVCGGGAAGSPIIPIVLVDGDRNTTQVEQQQIRLVGGIRGDLPFWNGEAGDGLFGLTDWTYELSGSYQRSFGTSVRRGIIEDRLALSLLTTTRLGDGSLACGIDPDGDGIPNNIGDFDIFGFLGGLDCVPVDLVSAGVQGLNALTPEEQDYLFGVRTFSTEIQQSIIQGYFGGNVANLPAGEVGVVVGFEYRQDEIDSRPDDNAEDGNFIGFFSDRGATGRREIKEGFAEIHIPIFKDQPFAKDLWIEGSGRVTNESFYGTNWVYAVKGLWKPFDFLTIRGTRGTSFRAPNLREQFFKGATGFVSGFNDPCIVPAAANVGMMYDPTFDTRTATTLANCVAAGVDPTSLGLAGSSSLEVLTGGTTLLDAETSRTFTVGGVLDVPFADIGLGDSFRTQLSVTHFDILVRDTVEEPSVAFLFDDCYSDPGKPFPTSAFCNRITRDPATGFVDLVDAGFINIGVITSRGFDFNALFEYDGLTVGGETLELSLDAKATMLLEQTQTIITDFDDNRGEFGTPKWRGQAIFFADWSNWRGLWRARYIGKQDEDGGVDPDNIGGFGNGDTCRPFLGLSPAPRDLTDEGCANIDFAPDYIVHDASLTWRNDLWSVTAGINNVLDKRPPQADSSAVTVSSAGNIPLGVGYDLFGRTFQFSIQRRF